MLKADLLGKRLQFIPLGLEESQLLSFAVGVGVEEENEIARRAGRLFVAVPCDCGRKLLLRDSHNPAPIARPRAELWLHVPSTWGCRPTAH